MTTTAHKTVDCSSNNGTPNVTAYAKAGHKHLIRKVTEGNGYHWFEGDTVADQAHAHGIHVGHYHWLREDSDPISQAHFFVTAVKPHLGKAATRPSLVDGSPSGDWLMVDVEQTAGVNFPGDAARAQQVREFAAEVNKQLPGYVLTAYTGNWYLDNRPKLQAEMRRYLTIIAAYTPTLPTNPYRLTYFAWQFTDSATVAGFAGPVDYNVFLGSAPVSDPVQVSILNAARLLRAAMFGGKFATSALRKKYPKLAREKGVVDRLDDLETQVARLTAQGKK